MTEKSNQIDPTSLATPAGASRTHGVVTATSFSGPLPPPAALEAYDRIHPGAADRIISMAERQAEHRQGVEKKVVTSMIRSERLGMWFAFILTVALMIIGGILIALDKKTAGYFAVFGPVVFHAGNYLYSKFSSHEKEESDK